MSQVYFRLTGLAHFGVVAVWYTGWHDGVLGVALALCVGVDFCLWMDRYILSNVFGSMV